MTTENKESYKEIEIELYEAISVKDVEHLFVKIEHFIASETETKVKSIKVVSYED